MAKSSVSKQQASEEDPRKASPSSVVEGEMTPMVRVIRVLIAVLIVGAVVAGFWRGSTSPETGKAAIVSGLYLTETALAAILILLGSFVEGFGYGLSLGTQWPYTRNILVLMFQGDPEAAHRVVATLVGLIAVALAIMAPSSATINGLVLIVVTALFGMGTLYVLSGRFPSVVHGMHGLLAYGVFICYLTCLYLPGVPYWTYLKATIALHAVLFTIFLGGMTTGQRGFGKPIGAFYKPEKTSQWTVAIHILSALSVVGTLGWLMPAYPVAFYLAVAQIAVGFLLFHAVNLKPKSPGVIVAFHQCMVLSITLAIVAGWR